VAPRASGGLVSVLGIARPAVITARRIRWQHHSQAKVAAIAVRVPLLILGVASLVVLGCGGPSGTNSSCAAVVRWNQTLYFGLAVKVPHGSVLGRGVVPACTADDDDQLVTVRRVANVPPALGVAPVGVPGKNSVYLAPGFFPVLAEHPLHRLLVREARGLQRPRRCSGRFRLRGAVLRTPINNSVPLRVGGRELSVQVVTGTKIMGFRRAGYPYLQRSDMVEVRGRRCDLLDYARAYVADVVTPAV
jgi:hypothetical protein